MSEFLFILQSEDNQSATRCFQFAKVAHEKGHIVNVFLVDGAVAWADPDKERSQKTTTGDAPGDYLPYLVEQEVPIGV